MDIADCSKNSSLPSITEVYIKEEPFADYSNTDIENDSDASIDRLDVEKNKIESENIENSVEPMELDSENLEKHSNTRKTKARMTKRSKKVMTLQEKVKVLDMLREGHSKSAVGRYFGVNESTVRSIQKCETSIRSTVTTSDCPSAKISKSTSNKNFLHMESALMLWIADASKKKMFLDTKTIQQKARKLYNHITISNIQKIDENETELDVARGPSKFTQMKEFHASRGWFYSFLKRFQLKFVTLNDEVAPTDTAAAAAYPETLQKIIKEKGYTPHQVFNMDKTGLFWKKMPSRTYLMKEEARAPGFKAQKDRVTLLMCGNADGYMIKPGFIYKSANPRALKNKNKDLLPVFWMFNNNAWISKSLIESWFHQCFVPEVKSYLSRERLPFKVLLCMENTGGYHLDLFSKEVQIEFLPRNTGGMLQPLDQGIIRAFKALYTRNLLQDLTVLMANDGNFSLKSYWRTFTIANCLDIIQQSIIDLKKETLNACWKKLWPEVVNDNKGLSPEEVQHGAVKKAMQLAKMLGGEGFKDATEEDFTTLVDSHSAPLTDDDLLELAKFNTCEDEEPEKDFGVEGKESGLTLEHLSEILMMAEKLQSYIETWDPDMVCSTSSQNAIDSALVVYKDLFEKTPITAVYQVSHTKKMD